MLRWRDCRTEADFWDYHTEVYAWRRFRGFGTPNDTTSPVDPEGKWYSEGLVQRKLQQMQALNTGNCPPLGKLKSIRGGKQNEDHC